MRISSGLLHTLYFLNKLGTTLIVLHTKPNANNAQDETHRALHLNSQSHC